MDRQQLAEETALYADTMTAQERQAAYARGEEADRLPTAVSVRGTMAPFYGYTQAQYRADFAVRAEVYRRAEADFGCSGVAVGPNLHKMGIAMGAKPIVLPDMTEQLTDEPLVDYALLGSWQIPEPAETPVLREMLDEMARWLQGFGAAFPLRTEIGGPLTTAISLRPADLVYMDIVAEPQHLAELLDFSVECQLKWVEAVHRLFGVTSVAVADPAASCSLISPAVFRTLAGPALARLCRGVADITGRRPGLHICGRTKEIWADIADMAVSSFRVDSVEDIGELKNVIGDRVALCGNIPPVEVMLQGSIDDVLAAGRECIAKAADSGCGLTLAAGCQLPPGVSRDNLLAMVLAARKYGRGARMGRQPRGVS